MVIAALIMVGTIDVKLNETGFKLSLALFGVGAGLMMSQLGNVIMSSAPPGKTNEAGGLQGTAQNLGASLGTALIGSILLTGLLTGFDTRIMENPAYSESDARRRSRLPPSRESRSSRRTRLTQPPSTRDSARRRQTRSRPTTPTPSSKH